MERRPQLHDPRVLRAIAHPVRSRILTELGATGSMRAADIAARLGIPANQASFHLRQLAKFGLIEEDTAAARDKRDRVWRPTEAGGFDVSIGEMEKTPGGQAAATVFRRSKEAWTHQLVAQAYGDDRSLGTHRSVTEQAVRLTKTEASALTEQLADVVDKWRMRNQDSGEDGRLTYHVLAIVQPFPEPRPQ
jgi:predicted ArsR family transcriptional regulator